MNDFTVTWQYWDIEIKIFLLSKEECVIEIISSAQWKGMEELISKGQCTCIDNDVC